MKTTPLLLVIVAGFLLAPTARAKSPQRFERIVLSEEFHSEGCAVADINNDGANDIVSGPFWYEGPNFRDRHAYAPIKDYSIKGYSDHFFSFASDINGDGWFDILSVPIPGGDARWYQNPGKSDQLWDSHLALDAVGNESPTFTNIVGDKLPELVCIHDGQYGFAQRDLEQPTKPWTFTPVSDQRGYGRFTHGMGVGDVDGDGRMDLLEKDGWWQQTESVGKLFKFHPVKFAQSGGSQMFVFDVDNDDDQDVVSVQNAHGYGLCWFERRGQDDDFLFVKHDILGPNPADNRYGLAISQMHAVAKADIDGDGVQDLITGKRFWAHGGADPGAQELPVLYWLRTIRSKTGPDFWPFLIDQRVGVGTQLVATDVDEDGHVDIVVGNKLGTFLLLNNGTSEDIPEPTTIARHTVGTDEFKNGVRNTDPLSPQQEQATFVLPPGFEAQLVAAEPDIAKPMNMAFDAQGRLWVSSSLEYPFPAPADQDGRDTIKVLEDTTGDGRADKITTFADKLNIPIGLYPYGDGVICHSIPNIWYLRDTDGDGKCDKREILYGPFDNSRDTHGMCNAFTRGYDGWLYACHGFNNQSTVAGKDGNQVTMHSGNTFRMRLDGSRIEHFTHGQVNPFGMAFDSYGDLFTADCHTKPITLLLRHGYYQSFGAPHDGIGFVPNVMEHLHGSTAIGGIALYEANVFPSVYHGNAFGGNVMTSRVNRNSFRRVGSSISAREEPDFMISGDPWFRPVDLQIGPDGALYVADFYNRIIGHYEVSLQHPGRDRHRGRIWRIAFTGSDQRRDTAQSPKKIADRPSGDLEDSIAQLASDNLTVRMLASDQLVDQFGSGAIQLVREAIQNRGSQAHTRVHAFWVLQRLGALTDNDLHEAIQDKSGRVRNHAFQIIAAMEDDSTALQEYRRQGFSDPDKQVLRSVVMATMAHPTEATISLLLNLAANTNANDVHLHHAIRMSLRDHLKNESWFKSAVAAVNPRDTPLLIDLCLAIKTDYAGEFLVQNLQALESFDREQLSAYLTFAARYASDQHLKSLADLAQSRFADDHTFQEKLLRAIRDGLSQRGADRSPVIVAWASKLARHYLGLRENETRIADQASSFSWSYLPHPETPDRGNPWILSRKRKSADGQQTSSLHSSFPKGESLTGIYRSAEFTLPERFSFYVAGHDGFPDKPIQNKNLVRVRDAKSSVVLKAWSPPRNDTAQRIDWETGDLKGRDVYVELVDGDTARAYAWLAAGRFSVSGLNPSGVVDDRRKAAQLIGEFQLSDFRAVLVQLLIESQSNRQGAVQYARSLVSLNRSSRSSALAEAISIVGLDREQRAELIDCLTADTSDSASDLLGKAMKAATAAEQTKIAEQLVTDQAGLELLLTLTQFGQASPRLLQSASIEPKVSSLANTLQLARIAAFTKDLPSEDDALLALIQNRKQAFLSNAGNVGVGAELFKKQCAACHQVAGKGAPVGPNLDGIGNRGLDRIIEDVIQPNRNIDAAFRASLVLTEDGQLISGLVKRTEGAQLVIVDQKGKEISIPSDSITQQKTIRTSPMPANFHELLNAENTSDLLAYLLSLTH